MNELNPVLIKQKLST